MWKGESACLLTADSSWLASLARRNDRSLIILLARRNDRSLIILLARSEG
jgi:hypothetical protein